METAIGDSQQYGVLSFEEVDEIKKELDILASRIDGTKRKMALENKLRDAATSLNRLYSPTSRESIAGGPTKSTSKRHRRSMMSRGSGSDLLNKTDDELAATIRKCEDLSQELWRLEKRSQELQTRLLEHTAGVLQMTHKGYLDKDAAQQPENTNGYVNGFGGLDIMDVGHNFDDRSFYRTLDALMESGDGHSNGGGASSYVQQTQSIIQTERRLWDLNQRLRDAIAQASAGRLTFPHPPEPESSSQQDPETALQEQIEYMEKGLERMQRSQVEAVQHFKQSSNLTEERLEDLNSQLRGIIMRSSQDANPQCPPPPNVSGKGSDEQVAFLENGLDVLEQSFQRLKDNGHTANSKAGQYESELQGLWANMLAGEDMSRQQNRDIDGASESVPREAFSMELLSSKLESLQSRVMEMQEQKDILGRQIQQQRELNSKSDNEKDAKLTALTAELQQAKRSLETAKGELSQGHSTLEAELTASKQGNDQLLAELQEKHVAISELKTELSNNKQHQDSLRLTCQEKSAEADRARNEMEKFEGEMVRLQTELTVARAELDGAYGTRAQRAAEVASHPALQQEVAELNERNNVLNQRVQTLQKELSETIGEYEVMTKSGIEYEKERENMENTIDGLRDRSEQLETQLGDEKVRWLGMKSPGVAGDRSSNEKGATSTSVLKNEFKKMMRETRTENMRALRVSCNLGYLRNRSLTLY